MEAKPTKHQFNLNHKDDGHLVFNLPSRLKPKIVPEEIVPEVFPFLSLAIKNQAEFFKIGRSYIDDIAKNIKQFGFASSSNSSSEQHLLAYGSYINFTLKRPVLIIVKDLLDKSLDPYRENFTNGTLWKWNCSDWGSVCFIDYRQITAHSDSFNLLDFSVISNEFAAILWSLPEGDLNEHIPKNAFSILEKIDSVTLTAIKGKTLSRTLKKAQTYYQCFGIPVKGILLEGETK